MSERDRKPSRAAGRGKRDPAEIHGALLAAATTLFARDGIESVNSNQIAREAGVGVGTFYKHFADKLEVHQAVVLDTLESLRRAIEAGATDPSASIEDQVRALVIAIVEFADTNSARFRVAFGPEAPARRTSRANGGEPGARPQVGYSTRATERRLAELQAKGEVDPAIHPAVAARAFVAIQNGVVCWWLEEPGRAEKSALIETLVRLHPAIAGRTH